MCRKCRAGTAVDLDALDPEGEKFLKEHPGVRSYLENQRDQAKRLGTTSIKFNKEEAIEAWDRVTRTASQADRDMLANVFSVLINAMNTLNDPDEMLRHITMKALEQQASGSPFAGVKVMAIGPDGVKGFDLGASRHDPTTSAPAPKMTKEEIEELLCKSVTGKGGNA